MNCATCDFQLKYSTAFCPNCGAVVAVSTHIEEKAETSRKVNARCIKCGSQLKLGAAYCRECGTAVAGATALTIQSSKDKRLNFKTFDSLGPVVKIVEDAEKALQDKSRTIQTSDLPKELFDRVEASAMPEALGAISGVAVGTAVSYGLLYTLGVAGLSEAGIISGLTTAGALVGGGMAVGFGVLALPVGVLGIAGYHIVARQKRIKLTQAKEALLQRILIAQDAILCDLEKRMDATEERVQYLLDLVVMLRSALKHIREDFGLDFVIEPPLLEGATS